MTLFLSRSDVNRQTREKYWSPPSAAHPTRDARSGFLVTDPSLFVATLCKQFSVEPDPALLAAARSPPPGTRWWPTWVFETKQLRQHIGAPVVVTEDASLYNARFAWVGVPYPGVVPVPTDILHPTHDRFFAPCMVSLVTHDDPRNKQAYIWCTVNRDGDVVKLSNDVLSALLAPEIAQLKTQVKRTGSAIMDGERNDYVAAARLMAMNVTGLPGIDVDTLLPFQTADPARVTLDTGYLTPVSTTPLANREAVLNTVNSSIEKKRASGVPIVNPLYPAGATPAQRAQLVAILQYWTHYGQFNPAFKAAVQKPPHDDNTAHIYTDPDFVAFVRMVGDLFPPQE